MADLFEAAGLTPQQPSPLADRLRPQRLDEVVGQDHLLGPDGPIRRMAEARRLSSMILWGPPGTGKTSIARLLAKEAGYEFQQLSAVFSGVADLKKVFEGTHVSLENVETARAKTVEVETDRSFEVYADGDPLTATPVKVTVREGALRLIAP